jgi:hypothetical protein
MENGSVRLAVIDHRTFACLYACAVFSFAPTLAADPVTRTTIEDALSGFEAEPDLATVRAWGVDGERLLLQIARDPTLHGVVQVRAVRALRAFAPDAGVLRFLRETAARPTTNLFVRRACFDALLEGFDDIAEIARYLADPIPEVRDGAAWTLSRSPRPEARRALRARLAVETDPTVRATLAQANAPLSSMRAAAPSIVVPVTGTAPVAPTPSRRVEARTVQGR